MFPEIAEIAFSSVEGKKSPGNHLGLFAGKLPICCYGQIKVTS